MNKYTSNSSKGCVLELDLEYPKDLLELHNDYPLALHKTKIEREILSDHQLKIADLYNIPIGKVKKSVPNVLGKGIVFFNAIYRKNTLYTEKNAVYRKNI